MYHAYASRHLIVGWWSLFLFATFGLVLEALHGFKVGGYLDVSNETRRFLWTLAHAHGVGLAIVNVLFGLTLRGVPDLGLRNLPRVSSWLVVATVLLPGGFFLGGIAFYGGDPGLGVVLVPAGAILVLAAVWSIAGAVSRHRSGPWHQ